MREKITEQHLSRKTVLYVRQSSPQQVANSTEGRRLQYAMQQRLMSLGWKQVEVIDEDLGRSAAGTAERTGFQKMVADVCLGCVGAVAAREVSRFARNSRDWQQLIEVCRMVNTLLVDHETVYDPRNTNDRLLLGLKGTMNEYELDLLRLRSAEAREQKAKRGEFVGRVAVGFVNVDGRIEMDPDKRVQQAVRLVFDKVWELGSARQAYEWLVENRIEIPSSSGRSAVWRIPRYVNVLSMVKNPVYAGVYAYGRTKTMAQIESGQIRQIRQRQPRDNWLALIKDHHESYIELARFEQIQEMLKQNKQVRGNGTGAPKVGSSLLAGLMRCRRCGLKLGVAYTGPSAEYVRYWCTTDSGGRGCFSFGGRRADDAIAQQVLRAVQPAAMEAAALAAREVADNSDQLIEALQLEVEHARYAAERARKQYDQVDPDNRLVADELERRWEAALKVVQEAEQRLGSVSENRNKTPPASLDLLRDLAADFQAVWDAPKTDMRLKKRLVRTLIEEIVVDLEYGDIVLFVHWKGGIHTTVSVRKFRTGQGSKDTPTEVVEAIQVLALVCDDKTIAAWLSRNDIKTPQGNRWTWKKVAAVRNYRSIAPASKQPTGAWMTLSEAAEQLGMTRQMLTKAAQRGLFTARHPLPTGPWVVSRETVEQTNAAQLIRRMSRRQEKPVNAGTRASARQLNLIISATSDKGAL